MFNGGVIEDGFFIDGGTDNPAANAPADDSTIAIPEERPAATPSTANDDDVIIIPQEEKSAGNQTDDVIIDFGDTPTEEDPQSGKQKKDAYELEDEYYDLDGF